MSAEEIHRYVTKHPSWAQDPGCAPTDEDIFASAATGIVELSATDAGAGTDDTASTSPAVPQDRPAVILQGPDDPPIVFGKKRPVLNARDYYILKALLDAWPVRLHKAQLERKCRRSEAHKNLAALRKEDRDWKKAILMAGTSGKGYGIAESP